MKIFNACLKEPKSPNSVPPKNFCLKNFLHLSKKTIFDTQRKNFIYAYFLRSSKKKKFRNGNTCL